MTEDFNPAPISIEDKQEILDIIDNTSLKIEQIECSNCQIQFSNKINLDDNCNLITHLKESNHNSLKIIDKNNPSNKEDIKCCICSESNIFKLFILINTSNDKTVLNIKNIIFCKNHAPKIQIQPILDILEIDEIVKRKLNKVKLTYENKYDYYQIYKPLLIADMLYTRKVYEKKTEYNIKLCDIRNERFYFEIEQNFIDIDFSQGRVLKFTEEKEEYEENENIFQFNGVIVNVENILENENNLKIWIIPINRHITSLEGHIGQYKIKEEYCLIPYQRMNEALELFYNDTLEDEIEIFNRPVSLYLTRRILGDFPSKEELNNDKDGKIKKNWKIIY